MLILKQIQLILIVLAFGLLAPIISHAETLYFDVIRNETIIGELTAKKSIQGKLTTYTTSSRVNTRLVVSIEVFNQFEVTMYQNQLKSAEALVKVNGDIRDHTITYKDKQGYCVQFSGSEKCLTEQIYFPGVLLMFKEPVLINRSFSEIQGRFHEIQPLGNHSYRKTNQKGQSDTYYYKDGKLQRAVIDAGMIGFELVLRK